MTAVDDWLEQAGRGDRVLDIGSAGGSFSTGALSCTVIAVDEDPGAFAGTAATRAENRSRVVGRSQELPIASGSIDLVICNHGLEHFCELQASLDEIKRVLKPDGKFYLSVPNGFGLCDSVYRWMFEGGGHVNRFRCEDLIALVQSGMGLHLARWQRLYSSFQYLHSLSGLLKSPPSDLQHRLKQVARLPLGLLSAAQWLLYGGTRILDRLLGTQSAVYGWAFWFDRGAGPAIQNEAYVNVCMFCGSGHPAGYVRRLRLRRWVCASCQRENPFWWAAPPHRG